jgi:triphosphoribosyl-dephospho-CoA synthase
VAVLAQAACLLEVSAPKPGNVSRGRDFEDTTFEDFLLSAAAIGPAFARGVEAGVGAIVLQAVEDTRRLVSPNTNLGIVLLLAPLACAACRKGGALRDRLGAVLAHLTIDDARAVHRAIRLANPGGLGRVESQDVREEPTLPLREIMSLAAGRDLVASEYATGYEVTFGRAVPVLRRAREAGRGWSESVLEAYLDVLAEIPDSLIARKEGSATAEAVRSEARRVLAAGEAGSRERAAAVDAFDAALRGPGNRRNPGATADLTAAAIFVALAEGP